LYAASGRLIPFNSNSPTGSTFTTSSPHDEYVAECKTLVTKHWPMIEAVANRLLKEEVIGGSEVYTICERVARHVVRRQHLDRTAR
jgi:hypothetical protein